MSQKRNSVAAALMARMAAMAERVPDWDLDEGAIVVMVPQCAGDGAEHERGEQQRQIDDAHLEQVAGHHAALRLQSVARRMRAKRMV